MSFEDNIRKVIPYTPGEQPQRKVIKLNTNECPYPPSEKAIKALREFDTDLFRKYPDPECSDLVKALADYYNLDEKQVFVGVGSDDVLSMCFLTFFAGKKPVLFPDITYSFYDVWADVYRIPYETIALDEDFNIRAEDYKRDNGGIVIANPNAPTGVEEPLEKIEEIIKSSPDSIVIVDEAYVDFGVNTALPLINKYKNLIVTRTMSKSRALAGMRIGYAFADERLIKYLNDVKFSVNSYTMNMPALTAGKAAILDDDYFREIRDKVVNTREWTKKELKRLGFSFRDSKTNFIFAKHEKASAEKLFEELKANDIYVRYFKKERLSDYLRISIGTDEEMKRLIEVLEGLL
ncbi:histidinol-phosphate transaminase [Lachnospiraceae bacterium C1.1]|nr:histidinol-phosphate transaminase [Lachnospiraceae bacterium C1.1]